MTAPNTTSAARVSIHGGHSKEFGDANDSTLEEVVRAYPCVPGDDSHGVAGVGLHLEKGIEILKQTGFSTNWQIPKGYGT